MPCVRCGTHRPYPVAHDEAHGYPAESVEPGLVWYTAEELGDELLALDTPLQMANEVEVWMIWGSRSEVHGGPNPHENSRPASHGCACMSDSRPESSKCVYVSHTNPDKGTRCTRGSESASALYAPLKIERRDETNGTHLQIGLIIPVVL